VPFFFSSDTDTLRQLRNEDFTVAISDKRAGFLGLRASTNSSTLGKPATISLADILTIDDSLAIISSGFIFSPFLKYKFAPAKIG